MYGAVCDDVIITSVEVQPLTNVHSYFGGNLRKLSSCQGQMEYTIIILKWPRFQAARKGEKKAGVEATNNTTERIQCGVIQGVQCGGQGVEGEQLLTQTLQPGVHHSVRSWGEGAKYI